MVVIYEIIQEQHEHTYKGTYCGYPFVIRYRQHEDNIDFVSGLFPDRLKEKIKTLILTGKYLLTPELFTAVDDLTSYEDWLVSL